MSEEAGLANDLATQKNIVQFGNYIADQHTFFKQSQRVAKNLSYVFNIPKNFVSYFLNPHLPESYLFSLNDMCFLCDLAGLNNFFFTNNHLRLLNRYVSPDHLKFLLSSISVGCIPDIREVHTVFGIGGKLGSLLQAIFSTH